MWYHSLGSCICLGSGIAPVFLLQNKVLWAITYIRPIYFSIYNYFSTLRILKLHNFFKLKLLSFVYNCANRISPPPPCFQSFFELVRSVHQYGTRQVSKSNISVTHKNTVQYGLKFTHYCGAKYWNGIPIDVKNSPLDRQKPKVFFFESND